MGQITAVIVALWGCGFSRGIEALFPSLESVEVGTPFHAVSFCSTAEPSACLIQRSSRLATTLAARQWHFMRNFSSVDGCSLHPSITLSSLTTSPPSPSPPLSIAYAKSVAASFRAQHPTISLIPKLKSATLMLHAEYYPGNSPETPEISKQSGAAEAHTLNNDTIV